MRPRHVLTFAGVGMLVLLAGSFYSAFTASATVGTSAVGNRSSTVTPNDLKPAECTMTVTSVLAGSGTFNATAQYQLVLGSSVKDTVNLQQNDCFVGGGPTSSQKDNVSGTSPGSGNGDQCIVASGATATRCTVVATRP
jgi:hypothetical protein